MRENIEYREKLLLPLRLKTFFLEGNLYRLDDRSQQSDYKTKQKYWFFFQQTVFVFHKNTPCNSFKVKDNLNLPSSSISFLQIQSSRHHRSAQMEPSISRTGTALTHAEIS